MPTPPKTSKTTTTTESGPVVISMGCPSGIGPEVAVRAALRRGAGPSLIVGDWGALKAAAKAAGLKNQFERRVQLARDLENVPFSQAGVAVVQASGELAAADRRPGKPSAKGGLAQLLYVEAGYALAKRLAVPLVTGPVSKEAIAKCGLRRAAKFRGHTEWLEELDGAPSSVMCFSSPKLTTALVTTHVPVRKVSALLTEAAVLSSLLELADLLLRVSGARPRLCVSAFNPHAGEGGLLGKEEETAIIPAIEKAQAILGRRVKVVGPIGAETAYRKGAAGHFEGVLAMYHDQATIPMKLIDFGGAVNVTQGLSIVRTSVDHGTAYDIAGRGEASADGMIAAVELGLRLGKAGRRVVVPNG